MSPVIKGARSVSEQVRDAIRDSGLSVRELAARAEVSPAVIHRFLSGERSPTLDTVDKLGAVLRLRVQAAAPRR